MSALTNPSVRLRITAVVAVLVAVALFATGLSLYAVESNRFDQRVEEAINQEIDEFTTLQRDGTDPGGFNCATNGSGRDLEPTGDSFATLERLMCVFISRNVTASAESIVGFYGDGPRDGYASPGTRTELLATDRDFVDLVDRLRDRGGGFDDFTFGEYGRAIVTVLPASDDRNQGAFAIAYFVDRDRNELIESMTTYAWVALAAWSVIVLVAFGVAGRLLKPIQRLRTTAQAISDGDLSQRIPIRGNDDLTVMTLTVNEMLDRLESAFAAQRRLLDDAGHELRTPLTILRGHLELIDADDPEELESTRHLLMDEIDRMARLVNDLLMIAKAQRPDFVETEPTDVGALVRDVLVKARAIAAREWRIDHAPDVVAVIDPQRLTQALLQLADNAAKHTAEGTVVSIGARHDGDTLQFWVRDLGSGIAREDRVRVFQRFQRGSDTSRDTGFGLGLTIVTAIAEAHGGHVQLDDPPIGALFRIVIPYQEAPK